MATIEYWIQLENRRWDACPNNIERMHGGTIQQSKGQAPVAVGLRSPGTGRVAQRTMFRPMRGHALILRRYRPPEQPDGSDAWTVPDDRKVNPWDLNEPNPTDAGTLGTIPGAILECNVGDRVIVHFRNLDLRTFNDLRAPAAAPPGSAGSLAFATSAVVPVAPDFPDTLAPEPIPSPSPSGRTACTLTVSSSTASTTGPTPSHRLIPTNRWETRQRNGRSWA